MPFKSSAQMRAAFGGFLGPEMKAKATEFAAATPSIKSLPARLGSAKAAAAQLKKKKNAAT